MASVTETALRRQILDRRGRLQEARAREGAPQALESLLHDVDAALERLDHGDFGLCETCREPIEEERLLADPLVAFCLDHLTPHERQALQQDLSLAGRMQASLLPPPHLSAAGWHVCRHYEPAGPVSGDYCDVVLPEREGDGAFVLFGDVSGKGVAASLVMAHLRALLRGLISAGLGIEDLLSRANRMLCESTLPTQYATLVGLRVAADGALDAVNAGHLPPLLVRGGDVTPIAASGLPLGLFCETPYARTTLGTKPGDLLVLYTDGLSEAGNAAGEEYGVERLSRVVARQAAASADAVLRAVLQDVLAFRGAAPRTDDLTVMVLRREAAGSH